MKYLIKHFKQFLLYKQIRKMEISSRWVFCKIDVHRASYAKHLESKKPLENEKQNELIIPERFFKEPIQNKNKKIYSPKPFKQIVRDNIKKDDTQLIKELAEKMIKPYYFTDRVLQVAFDFTLESHDNIHANSEIFIKPNYPEFGIEFRYNIKIIKEISVIYARLINQYKFKYQTVSSARFDK